MEIIWNDINVNTKETTVNGKTYRAIAVRREDGSLRHWAIVENHIGDVHPHDMEFLSADYFTAE